MDDDTGKRPMTEKCLAVYAIRNHDKRTEIEQIFCDFHTQLQAAEMHEDQEAFDDVYRRVAKSAEGFVQSLQPKFELGMILVDKKTFKENNSKPIERSTRDQQKRVEKFRGDPPKEEQEVHLADKLAMEWGKRVAAPNYLSDSESEPPSSSESSEEGEEDEALRRDALVEEAIRKDEAKGNWPASGDEEAAFVPEEEGRVEEEFLW